MSFLSYKNDLATNSTNFLILLKIRYYFVHVWPVVFSNICYANIYLFKINDGKSKTIWEICSKLIIETPGWRRWDHFGVFVFNFKQMSNIDLAFPLLPLNKQISTGLAIQLHDLTGSTKQKNRQLFATCLERWNNYKEGFKG